MIETRPSRNDRMTSRSSTPSHDLGAASGSLRACSASAAAAATGRRQRGRARQPRQHKRVLDRRRRRAGSCSQHHRIRRRGDAVVASAVTPDFGRRPAQPSRWNLYIWGRGGHNHQRSTGLRTAPAPIIIASAPSSLRGQRASCSSASTSGSPRPASTHALDGWRRASPQVTSVRHQVLVVTFSRIQNRHDRTWDRSSRSVAA